MAVGYKKFTMEYVVPKIKKNLKERFDTKQKAFKSIDEKGKGLSLQKRSDIKKSFSGKVSNIINPVKKAKGGRVGLKLGTKKKSNVDKIKKTFGTLSVRAGIDNNPNITYADKIAGAKMKNKKTKKKVI